MVLVKPAAARESEELSDWARVAVDGGEVGGSASISVTAVFHGGRQVFRYAQFRRHGRRFLFDLKFCNFDFQVGFCRI